MNYHAKSGASSLKIDWVMLNLIFGGHFVFLAAILFFGGHFVFWRPFLFRVNMNYHAKSGVMLNLIFGGHLIFWQPFCFFAAIFLKGWLRVVKIYLHAKSRACSLKNEWVTVNLIFGGHFVFGGHFFSSNFVLEGQYLSLIHISEPTRPY